MAAMLTDRVWACGRGTRAACIGALVGLGLAAFVYAWTGSFSEVASRGVIFGLTFGALAAHRMWRRWPQAEHLAPDDRVAVSRVVRTGADIGDARLAAAVVDYAGEVRRDRERAPRQRWSLPLITVAGGGLAVAYTVAGDTRKAIVFFVLTAWTVVVVGWWAPRQRAREITNARQAEAAARRWGANE
jgi:hypothetical protein